jgi:glycosyltransferase involved in cell wall biosynthesis
MTSTNRLHLSLDVTAVPPNPAGAGRYIIELAKGLASAEDLQRTYFARGEDAFRWESMNAEVRAVAPASRPQRLLWEQLRLPALLRKASVDVHHSPHYTMPEHSKTPTVVTIHDLTFFDNPELHERSKVVLFRRAITVAAKRADAIIAVSHDTAARMRERFGDIDITVIPHGIDHGRFNTVQREGERHELTSAGVPEQYIAFVGTIEPRKNLPRLVRSFVAIAAKYPQLHLVIAGQRGWALDDFDQSVATSPNSDRIVQPGYLSESLVPALLRHARVVAYPSLVEGFGLPALEALACGAPLVTGRGSAMQEVVGGAGILVDQNDTEALIAGLEQALEADPEVAKRIGPEAAAAFTWESAVSRHIEVYRRVARR